MTQFSLLGRVIAGRKAEKARAGLKRRLKALGELRDIHVQKVFCEQQMDRFPEIAQFHEFLQNRERRVVDIVAAKVERWKNRKLKKCVSSSCEELLFYPEMHGHQEPLPSTIRFALTEAFEEVVRRRQTIDPANSQTIHRTRVAFKRFRYMVESLSPAFTGLTRAQLRRFGDYQRRMGNLQDLEILQAAIVRFLEDHPLSARDLTPFCEDLKRRHARALRFCLKRADDLFAFWPASSGQLEQRPKAA